MDAIPLAIVAIASLAGIGALAAAFRSLGSRPDSAFLVAFATLSLLCLVALPGFSTADEAHHFLRSYGIAHGKWIENEENPDAASLPEGESDTGLLLIGDYFPEGLLPYADDPPTFEQLTGQSVMDSTQRPLSESWDAVVGEGLCFYGFSNTVLYSPVSYLPQALAIAAADAVTDRPWIMYYAARLALIATYGALACLAIRAIPRGKHLLCTIALCPRAVAEANSVGADAFVVALCMLLVALVLKYRAGERRLEGGQIAGLAATSACIALSKIVYLPVVFLVLLVPRRCYREKGGLAVALAIALGACALNVAWLGVSMGILHGVPMNYGVDSSAQADVILHDPLRFAWVMASTLASRGARLAAGMFSGTYYYGAVRQSLALTIATCTFIALAWLFDRKGMTLGKTVRIVFAAVFAVIVVLAATSLYLQWTEVGAAEIAGLQGRYFLPTVIMLLLAVQPDTPRLSRLASGLPNLAFYAAYLLLGAFTLYAPLARSLA